MPKSLPRPADARPDIEELWASGKYLLSALQSIEMSDLTPDERLMVHRIRTRLRTEFCTKVESAYPPELSTGLSRLAKAGGFKYWTILWPVAAMLVANHGAYASQLALGSRYGLYYFAWAVLGIDVIRLIAGGIARMVGLRAAWVEKVAADAGRTLYRKVVEMPIRAA